MTKYLVHFGVKGMKWGVRRKRDEGSGTGKRKGLFARKSADQEASEWRSKAKKAWDKDVADIESRVSKKRLTAAQAKKELDFLKEVYHNDLNKTGEMVAQERRTFGRTAAVIMLATIGGIVIATR